MKLEKLDHPAMIKQMEELDVVELLTEIPSSSWRDDSTDPWPAGTTGTVLELTSKWALVEISDDDGQTLDMIDVRPDQAKVVWAIKDHPVPDSDDDITVRAATRSRRT